MKQPLSLVLVSLQVLLLALVPSAPRGAQPDPQDFAALRAAAEEQYARGGYAQARELYTQAAALELTATERRWVRMRLADSAWRADAAAPSPDPSTRDAAQRELEALVQEILREDERDLAWAEAQESLGDMHWREQARDWHAAWMHYEPALQHWARSPDLERARARYLAIVWRAAAQQGWDDWMPWLQVSVPLPVLRSALEIAATAEERARAHFLLAKAYQASGQVRAVRRHYEAALEEGREQAWHDDALYGYAQWLESSGRLLHVDGVQRVEPDYARALELYRELTRSYRAGESRWRDDAERRIADIVAPRLLTRVERIFPPATPVVFQLAWRNLERVSFALYPVDLVADLRGRARTPPHQIAELLELAGREALLTFERTLEGRGPHVAVEEQVSIERELAAGAYVLVATSGGQRWQELILVSDAALVVQAGAGSAIAWMVDALSGAPIAGADVVLWHAWNEDERWKWNEQRARTGDDGLAAFQTEIRSGASFLAVAKSGARQALATGGLWWNESGAGWRIQAWTDRPAYRPEDTVHFQVQGRSFDGARYKTPRGAKLRYTIRDPRGGEAKAGELTLDEFGSAWGELALGATMVLGEYQIELRSGEAWIGGAQLFRLEEYKLPEFLVQVTPTPPEGGQASWRLGDTLRARIDAQYYFGGPVAGAEVEVVVRQQPHVVGWRPQRPYPWYFDQARRHGDWGGTEVLRQTLRTDAEGRAHVEIPTPSGADSDFLYSVQARVRDLSRREVSGSGSVHVGRQGYYVFAHTDKRLYRPGDEVEVLFRTQDAGGAPVAAAGSVEVARERWVELWIDPAGREVDGDEVQQRFGPRPGGLADLPPAPGWRLKVRGYQHEVLSTRPIASDAKGEARARFQPERVGAYRITWRGADADGAPITGDTSVWVVEDSTTLLAWRRGEVELLVDRESLRAGEEALVMISTATSGGHVLFSVAGERLHAAEVLAMQGNARLVRVRLDERHVPNTFLRVVAVRGGMAFEDSEELVVPPVEQFLELTLELPPGEVRPGSESEVRLTARGHDGEPVRAQVALSIFDEAVLAIQPAYAADPRQFYYGEKRALGVHATSSFQWRAYGRLVRDSEGRWVDERDQRRAAGLRTRDLGAAEESLSKLGYAGAATAGLLDMVVANAEMQREAAPATLALDPAAGAQEQAVVVRTDFRASAFFQPDVRTDEDGKASVRVRWPQSLTRWTAEARAATQESRFGLGSGTARTSLPLTARLQAPRFFVAGDLAAVSGIFDNRTDVELRVRPELLRDGQAVADAGFGDDPAGTPAEVTIPAHGQARVDWFLRFDEPGATTFRLTARGGEHADSMERTLKVWPRGIDQLLAQSGKLPPGGATVRFELPAARRAGSTRLSVQLAPSLATTMLDALPYLIEYPYGCTEQTMSRFLPAVIVQRTLASLGLDADAIAGRAFGGIEPGSAAATHPKPGQGLAKLDDVTRKGLQRLYDFQRDDGGWGWWKGGEADPFMSAYVVWGLALAHNAGVDVEASAAQRGAEYLERSLVEAEARPDLAAWLLHALAEHLAAWKASPSEGAQVQAAVERLWAQHKELHAYGRALFALAAQRLGQTDRARILVENLVNGVVLDKSPDTSIVREGAQQSGPFVQATAHWGESGLHWRWWESGVEATSTALRALLAVDPQHELIPSVVHWLVRNRRGAQWSSTRDTAMAVLALERYLLASGELSAELDFTLSVNGKELASRHIGSADVLGPPARFEVDPALLRDGPNQVRVQTSAGKALYFAVEARFFSLEDPLPPLGNEVFVRREYWKLVPERTLLAGVVLRREPLAQGESIASGTRIEAVLTLEAKNDLEYLLLEDLKPAGLEAVALQSSTDVHMRELRADALDRRLVQGAAPGAGEYGTGRVRWIHQELRDRAVVSFADKLPQGIWELRYELRAEVPGRFHALPAIAQAMYVPEIRGNSGGGVVGVD